MAGPLIADTGGLLRAIAKRPDGRPSWPAHSRALAAAIDQKFHGLEIGIVEGVVAAVAERPRIYRILTIDLEDFGPLRVGQRYTQRLEVVP